jgi:hypothetical protein
MVTVHVAGTPSTVDGVCAHCGQPWRGDALVVYPVTDTLHCFRRSCAGCVDKIATRHQPKHRTRRSKK